MEAQKRFEEIFKVEYHEKKGTYIDCTIAAYNLAVSDMLEKGQEWEPGPNNERYLIVDKQSILKLKIT
jgi:hypothetical protein